MREDARRKLGKKDDNVLFPRQLADGDGDEGGEDARPLMNGDLDMDADDDSRKRDEDVDGQGDLGLRSDGAAGAGSSSRS